MQNIQDHRDEFELHLDKRGVHRIENRHSGVVIHCEKGVLWITQTGDGVDHVLYAGDKFISRKRGRLLIEAMREATMQIAASVQNRSDRRIRLPLSRAA